MPKRTMNFVRRFIIGALPFIALLLAWLIVPKFEKVPEYLVPSISAIVDRFLTDLANGTLIKNVTDSLGRLAIGFIIGNALAIPIGIAIALNRGVSDAVRPVLSFLQSIAGIAWVPLAIVWFGIGLGSVVFVIANTIFFSSINNVVIGTQLIPNVLYRAVRCHGATRFQVLTHLIIPGALTQIIVGLRTSMAYGWRALIGAEMLAGASGLGYLTIDAVQYYQTDTVLMAMILIGCLWMVMDRILFVPLEQRTVVRWGLVRD